MRGAKCWKSISFRRNHTRQSFKTVSRKYKCLEFDMFCRNNWKQRQMRIQIRYVKVMTVGQESIIKNTLKWPTTWILDDFTLKRRKKHDVISIKFINALFFYPMWISITLVLFEPRSQLTTVEFVELVTCSFPIIIWIHLLVGHWKWILASYILYETLICTNLVTVWTFSVVIKTTSTFIDRSDMLLFLFSTKQMYCYQRKIL